MKYATKRALMFSMVPIPNTNIEKTNLAKRDDNMLPVYAQQTIDKFGARWRALKPQEMKDWSTAEVERVFTALGDWREQFQEHQSKVPARKRNEVEGVESSGTRLDIVTFTELL